MDIVATDNGGDGVRVEGDVDLDIGGIRAERNGGQGVNLIKHASIMDPFLKFTLLHVTVGE
ncbi:hypothetical protein GCM10007916_00290 [Psychromonas marina]|uniref:Uncharacterized protein n=1 Tax=Psychromonas marina TaxID=88364 RepID=A0ABQ6DV75_9GAMM|nr:hypothetical protein [Psychromonas marina]GLS88962.1 hypothetical protein GCM10007916_00290 [Psychromonas marina]